MSATTEIQWTDATWNPVTGCTEVSPGCDHCYAKTFAERWRGIPGHPYEQGFDLKLWPERLGMPLKWRKPRRVFVNSMSDLFHDGVPDEFIGQVFAMMGAAPQHTFQVLTKRPGRMASLLRNVREPLPNVWLGTSVESQKWADVRIPKLLETPAAVRFLSCEPLLGPLDLTPYLKHQCDCDMAAAAAGRAWDGAHYRQSEYGPRPDWVIVGGESGPGHRPMDLEWARSLRDQCRNVGVAYFYKQQGGRTPKAGGRELDGREWSEFPVAP